MNEFFRRFQLSPEASGLTGWERAQIGFRDDRSCCDRAGKSDAVRKADRQRSHRETPRSGHETPIHGIAALSIQESAGLEIALCDCNGIAPPSPGRAGRLTSQRGIQN